MKKDPQSPQMIAHNPLPTIFERSFMNLVFNLFNKIEKGFLGFDDVFRRKWIYYLATCEAGFRERQSATFRSSSANRHSSGSALATVFP